MVVIIACTCCRQKRIGNILKVRVVGKFLVRTCIDKQLACKLFLFTTAGANSTLISSWHIQIGSQVPVGILRSTRMKISLFSFLYNYCFGYEHYKDVA